MRSLAKYFGALAVLALFLAAGWWLSSDEAPPRKVNEIRIVTLVPPPPPPPQPPEQPKMIEETHQQFEENRPDETPPEQPQDAPNKSDEPPENVLPGAEQPGPGDYRGNSKGLPGGRGGGSKWAAYSE